MQPTTEQKQPQICQRKTFAVIKASGENVLTYLQGQISQDTNKISATQAIYSAILTPQGKIITDFHLLQGNNDEVIMLCPHSTAQLFVERLRRFALGYQLRIGIVSAWQIWSIQGQDVDAYLKTQQLPIPAQGTLSTQHHEHRYCMRFSESAHDGVWLIGETLPLQHNIDEHIIIQQRILQGIPMFGIDWDAQVFPLNANLIERQGVSFDKGCYVGQEVTSRMHWRGGIKKKLYRVLCQHDAPTLPCPILTTAKIGILSSLTQHPQGSYQGIALLPIAVAESKQPLQLEDGTPLNIRGVCS